MLRMGLLKYLALASVARKGNVSKVCTGGTSCWRDLDCRRWLLDCRWEGCVCTWCHQKIWLNAMTVPVPPHRIVLFLNLPLGCATATGKSYHPEIPTSCASVVSEANNSSRRKRCNVGKQWTFSVHHILENMLIQHCR